MFNPYRQRDAADGPARTRRLWRGAAFRSNLQRSHLRSVSYQSANAGNHVPDQTDVALYHDLRFRADERTAGGRLYDPRTQTDDQRSGLVLLEDGTIAGSSKNMLYGVRNLAEILLKPITEIVKMTSENPADLFSLPHKGSITAGKDADLIVVDADFQLMKTFVEGRCAYQKGDVLTVNPDFLKTSVA